MEAAVAAGTIVTLGATPTPGVPGTSTLNATFSEAVDGVSGATMTVTATGAPVPGTATASVNKLTGTFASTNPFACGVQHTVNLTAGITDLAGNALAPLSRQFTTKQINTWSFIDGNGANGINRDATRAGTVPQSVAFNGKLYATWVEAPAGGGSGTVRVAVLEGTDAAPTWRSVDGDAVFGLNRIDGQDGRSPGLAVNDGRLFATWTELNGGVGQVRVASYNGNDAAPAWTFVDGNLATGLNKQVGRSASNPSLVSVANRLYAIWAESKQLAPAIPPVPPALVGTPAINVNQIRVARYDGNGTTSGWTFVDGNSTTDGINIVAAGDAFNPSAIAFNDRLYVTWDEAGNKPAGAGTGGIPDEPIHQIRVKMYAPGAAGAVGTWTRAEYGPLPDPIPASVAISRRGLNLVELMAAGEPSFAVMGGKLYLIWGEYRLTPFTRQIRVSVYNGYDGVTPGITSPAWSFIDGGDVAGINRNTLFTAHNPAALDSFQPPRLGVANGQLYATWVESTGATGSPGATAQVRAKVYNGTGTTLAAWSAVDGDAALGINKNSGAARSASYPHISALGSKVYALWSESNGTTATQIRAALAGCP